MPDRSLGEYEVVVGFLRLFGRGLKDVYDQFVLLMIVSIMWWVAVALIIPGPPATVALFRMADPRNQSQLPEIGDFFRLIRDHFKTAWGIAAFTIPVVLVLLWNIVFFSGGGSGFGILVPLWVVMIFITVILMLYAFATSSAMESKVRNAFRGATYLLVMRPFTSGILMVMLFVALLLLAAMVLPLILFGPAVMASVVNRFVLEGFGVEVIDPNRPTSERSEERTRGIGQDDGFKGFVGRMRGDKKGTR